MIIFDRDATFTNNIPIGCVLNEQKQNQIYLLNPELIVHNYEWDYRSIIVMMYFCCYAATFI